MNEAYPTKLPSLNSRFTMIIHVGWDILVSLLRNFFPGIGIFSPAATSYYLPFFSASNRLLSSRFRSADGSR